MFMKWYYVNTLSNNLLSGLLIIIHSQKAYLYFRSVLRVSKLSFSFINWAEF